MPANHERSENQRHHDHQQQTQKYLTDRLREIVDDPNNARMVAAECKVYRDTGDHADRESDQYSRVKRQAFRLVRRFVVEIRGNFPLKFIGADRRFGFVFSWHRISFKFQVSGFKFERFPALRTWNLKLGT
jgi:hypothetical protein